MKKTTEAKKCAVSSRIFIIIISCSTSTPFNIYYFTPKGKLRVLTVLIILMILRSIDRSSGSAAWMYRYYGSNGSRINTIVVANGKEKPPRAGGAEFVGGPESLHDKMKRRWT